MRTRLHTVLFLATATLIASQAAAQMYGQPDRGEPGDEMIQGYLQGETQKIHERFLHDIDSLDDWTALRPDFKQQYFHMLGLAPLPEKTPLKATVTCTLEGDGYTVEMLHYQSRPQLYVTGNLYRPAKVQKGRRLPAVFYVCGHSYQGRDGNKTAYQSHGIWFARHGYICLTVDSLQLGEIGAIHHGTYRENRWWWHSHGYTSAGVECWNGVRGIDYLISRPDVDPQRIAVTGISGGGAATFWIAAADDRVKVAVPVSGMADLPSYAPNRVINGHCDCMFLYNTFRWPWTRIAALIAPRPLLFVNSDHDRIFPMDANERVINRLEHVYRLHGAGDMVDAVVSSGGHAYRQDIRQAAYRFINTHLKDDPRVVTDSEVDLVTGSGKQRQYPIEPAPLRVFREDSDIPSDERNTTIDETFVPMAVVKPPESGKFLDWKASLMEKLERLTFRYFEDDIPVATLQEQADAKTAWLITEPGIRVPLTKVADPAPPNPAERILLVVQSPAAENDAENETADWLGKLQQPKNIVYQLAPRGVGPTRWTRKNPPNYIERSHVLLGRTVDAGRVWDIVAAAGYLRSKHGGELPVHVAGQGGAGVLAAYAALWDDEIDGAILHAPPLSHVRDEAPQLLNVLRICDVKDVLGMLAPRPLVIYTEDREPLQEVAQTYKAAGAPVKLTIRAR